MSRYEMPDDNEEENVKPSDKINDEEYHSLYEWEE